MDTMPLVLLLVVGLVFGILRFLSRPHTVIRIAAGEASVVRGTPPSGLVAELSRLAADAPTADGRVQLTSGGTKLELGTPGLDRAMEQRVRNVIQQYRDRIH